MRLRPLLFIFQKILFAFVVWKMDGELEENNDSVYTKLNGIA